MSFPKYPKYNDSGVHWLGEMPEHWEVKRMKCVADVFPSNVDKKEYESELPVKLCNYTDVYYNERIVSGMDFMRATASSAQVERFTLQEGDVLLTKDSETADDIAKSSYVPQALPGIVCGYHLSVARPRSGVHGAYLKRAFDSHHVRAQAEVSANGLTRVGLSQSAMDNICIPLPPVDEQRDIANFLDQETAKIDALIEEQRRLIGLLKEKRQAVISHAVIKGLAGDDGQKDSGVPWLGTIPPHWEVRPISYLSQKISYGFTNPMPAVAEGPYMLTANDIDFGKVRYETARRTSMEAYLNDITGKSRPKRGDILITKDGTLGRVAVHEDIEACINQSVASIRVDSSLIRPAFLAMCLQASVYQARILLDAGGTTIKHIYISRLAKMPVAIPGLKEQADILTDLTARLDEIDALMCAADEARTLLQERRSALISAAVTGKIDVRNYAPRETVTPEEMYEPA